jgi:hypothetical protein
MAPNTPRIPIFLDKRRRTIKRIATLGAEKVSSMPLGTTRDDDFAFDGRLARFTAGREEFVKVEVAVEARRLVHAIFLFEAEHVFVRRGGGKEGEVVATLASADADDTFGMGFFRFGIESDTFEMLAAEMAHEAFWVEARTSCGDNTARDRKCTLSAEDTCPDSCSRSPMRTTACGSTWEWSHGVVFRLGQGASGRCWSTNGDGGN